jgi:two-component system, chemotaxis family, protein-glutamate methylesterase/glutaminase
MPKRDIIVIGGSAGGIETLRSLVAGLPSDLPATIFIVMHTGADSPSVLDLILNRAGPLPAITPRDKQKIPRGKIVVAPPDHHLIIEPDRICLSRGPKENRFRPAIDPLFRSAAQVYGPRVIGVILTGGLDDGTAGLWAIKRLGGMAVVQDPRDALVPSMAESALRYVEVDHCVPLQEIAPLLVKLTAQDIDDKGDYEVPDYLDIEVKIAKQDPAIEQDVRKLWEKTSYTCPECHGVLLRLKESGRERFRCHTGHAFSEDSLLSSLTEGVEESLWATIRSIEETVMLLEHLSKHAAESNDSELAERLQAKAKEAMRRSELVRQATMAHEELNLERVEEEASSEK